jgi:uncharacterized membrane protein YccC
MIIRPAPAFLSRGRLILSGLPPKIPHKKSGKRHDRRETEGQRSGKLEQDRMGVFLRHNTTAQHHWNGRNLRIFQCQNPIAFPLSKALEAACPVYDTQGAGVVMQANNPIVVA